MRSFKLCSIAKGSHVNTIQDGPFRGCSRMGCSRQKGHLSLKSVVYILLLLIYLPLTVIKYTVSAHRSK